MAQKARIRYGPCKMPMLRKRKKDNTKISVIAEKYRSIGDFMDEKPKKKRGRPKGVTIIQREPPKNDIALSDNESDIVTIAKIAAIADDGEHTDWYSMRQRFYRYMQYCAEHDCRMTSGGAYLAMGLGKDGASEIRTGRKHAADSRYRETIAIVDSYMSAYRQKLMIDGTINPILGIFWEKASGVSDAPKDQEIIVDPFGDEQDAEKIANKYLLIGE